MQVWSLFMLLFQQDFVSKAKWGSLFGFCEKNAVLAITFGSHQTMNQSFFFSIL
jgi:hypothetical protein